MSPGPRSCGFVTGGALPTARARSPCNVPMLALSHHSLASHRLWAHPFQPQAAPHGPAALLSPLAPFRATLAGPQGCSSFQSTGAWWIELPVLQAPLLLWFWESLRSSRHQLPHWLPHHRPWSRGNWGSPISRLNSRDESVFQAKHPVLPTPPPNQPFPVSQPPKLQLVSESSWECVSSFWSRAGEVN